NPWRRGFFDPFRVPILFTSRSVGCHPRPFTFIHSKDGKTVQIPQRSHRGERETFVRGLVILPSLVVVCLRNEDQYVWTATATSEFSSAVPALSLSSGRGLGGGVTRQ